MNFKKILEKASAAIAIISIASAFFVGYGVGLSSFKYYIILAIIFGTVAYIFTKDEETSGHHLFNSFIQHFCHALYHLFCPIVSWELSWQLYKGWR